MGLGMGAGKLGCGKKCMKYILFTFNFIFWLSGVAILGVGIWAKVDPNISKYLPIIEWDESDNLLSTASWVIIGVGALVFIIGFCGCCGACMESTCLLNMYVAFVVFILLAEVAVTALIIVFSTELGDKLESHMGDQVKEDFKTAEQGGSSDPLTLAWHSLQKSLKCCGSTNYTDYVDSNFAQNSTDGIVVPVTCCVLASEDDEGDYIPQNYTLCNEEAKHWEPNPSQLYPDGCYHGLVDWLEDQSVMLIAIGVVLVVFEIFSIIFACCVGCGIKEDKRVRPMRSTRPQN